jgi:hypothetical protein
MCTPQKTQQIQNRPEGKMTSSRDGQVINRKEVRSYKKKMMKMMMLRQTMMLGE